MTSPSQNYTVVLNGRQVRATQNVTAEMAGLAWAVLLRHAPRGHPTPPRAVHLPQIGDARYVGFSARDGHWYVRQSYVVHLSRLDASAWETNEAGQYQLIRYEHGTVIQRIAGRFEPGVWDRSQTWFGAGMAAW